jgi:histidinol-phosphate phosphatase family protein
LAPHVVFDGVHDALQLTNHLALLARACPVGDSEAGGGADGCCYHSGVTDSQGSASKGTLRTVFLDRDGVLNEKMPEGRYVTAWAEFRLLAGVPEAIARLNRAGLRVIVVSNQRGIALGLYSAADVEAIHTEWQRLLQASGAHVDAFYFCPHDKEQCDCRKPAAGHVRAGAAGVSRCDRGPECHDRRFPFRISSSGNG